MLLLLMILLTDSFTILLQFIGCELFVLDIYHSELGDIK